MFLQTMVLTMFLAVASPTAAPQDLGLAPGEGATVTQVIDGDTVRLADGQEVRLVGIMAPKLSLGRDWLADQPLAEAARDALAALVDGKAVTLAYGGTRLDRHGRILAHLFLADGTWVQGAMLEAGLARVYSFADNRSAIAPMLALEAGARAAGLGIWSHPFYAVRDAAAPRSVPLDSYEIVEGVVVDAAEVDRRIYLNFGQDWTKDVTATIAPGDRATFRATHANPLALEGKRVRIRGWTTWRNGPSIVIDHPEQIEELE
ncbi:MAG: thermonuclease family protein [Proteobacteria bacterium]|nr:thermonuclease family protein [Pseudomonadota bacterium]